MRAAGECQQHHRAGKIEASVTVHARENASSFSNEASTLTSESLLRIIICMNHSQSRRNSRSSPPQLLHVALAPKVLARSDHITWAGKVVTLGSTGHVR